MQTDMYTGMKTDQYVQTNLSSSRAVQSISEQKTADKATQLSAALWSIVIQVSLYYHPFEYSHNEANVCLTLWLKEVYLLSYYFKEFCAQYCNVSQCIFYSKRAFFNLIKIKMNKLTASLLDDNGQRLKYFLQNVRNIIYDENKTI